MFDPAKTPKQPMLPFNEACGSCILRLTDLCEGTVEFRAHHMTTSDVVGCHDNRRIGKFASDAFAPFVPIPKSFNHDRVRLPRTVFGLTDGRIDLRRQNEDLLFGISMKVFFKDTGDFRFVDGAHLRTSLMLPPKARIALIGTSYEKRQQAIWRTAGVNRSWERLAEFAFEFVTSTSFPVWDENPRADQIIFQQRNYRVSDLMASRGLPVIPFVFPYNDTDYQTFGRWVAQRPSVRYVAVLATYYKHTGHFAHLVANMRRIQQAADRPLQFLIIGVSSAEKIRIALREFPNSTIVSSGAYSRAVAGRDLNRIKLEEFDKAEVWNKNRREFDHLVEAVL